MRTRAALRLAILGTANALLILGCGGHESTASQSAAAYDEAQRRGVPVGAGEHGNHMAASQGMASPAITGRAVALQVVEMRMGCPAADLQPDDARLDHDATHALAWISLPCCELQPVGRGLTPTDPRAATLSGPCRTGSASASAA